MLTLTLNVLAALGYALGALFMKFADGLRQPGASLGVFACFLVSAALQTIAMKHQEMSIGYIVVLGLEAIAATLLGVYVLREPLPLGKLLGITLVIVGVCCLRGPTGTAATH